ncbi:MAG: hypothetical protein KatS3mg038_1433 [Candidatus Kapaibacterium sp.]|nr:MAG: hypothetical protein KatS3mg038_1433 [Candidatus Kapabacteria bacterium]
MADQRKELPSQYHSEEYHSARSTTCSASRSVLPQVDWLRRAWTRLRKILVAIEYGLEIGLTPMAAVQSVACINGRPAVWGDALLAVCMASPSFDHSVFDEYFEGEGEISALVCVVGRVGRTKPTVRTFSVKDAKLAGLWAKPGPWQQFPHRMLQMRARSWALRDTFPDVLRGVVAAEELIGVMQPQEQPRGMQRLAERLGVQQSPPPVSETAPDESTTESAEETDTEHDESPAEISWLPGVEQ